MLQLPLFVHQMLVFLVTAIASSLTRAKYYSLLNVRKLKVLNGKMAINRTTHKTI
jgi:hypothetical protein